MVKRKPKKDSTIYTKKVFCALFAETKSFFLPFLDPIRALDTR